MAAPWDTPQAMPLPADASCMDGEGAHAPMDALTVRLLCGLCWVIIVGGLFLGGF